MPNPAVDPLAGSGFLPRPSAPAFVQMLKRYRLAGLPMVGVGSWGPSVPQTTPPSPDAPTVEQLDQEMKHLASARWGWISIYQPARGFAGAMSAQHRRQRCQHPAAETADRSRPERFFAPSMWASHACHVRLRSERDIAAMLELRADDVDADWCDRDWERFQSVSAAIERGDTIWAALGAWPWSAFPGGHPPSTWWHDRRAMECLLAAMAAQAEELTVRLSGACRLIDEITSG